LKRFSRRGYINIMKKRLHHNGQFVSEYESTGDDLKDIQIVEKIFVERGLNLPKPTLEQASFRQAISFTKIAADVFEKYIAKEPPDGSGMAPFVVNAVFSIELYMKTLAFQHAKKLHGHEITKLFKKLPAAAKDEIERQLATLSVTSRWACGISTIDDLRKVLDELDTAFQDWRYLHERNDSNPLKITFLPTIFLAEVLHEACAKGHVPEGTVVA